MPSMEVALVDGVRTMPAPGLKGECQLCSKFNTSEVWPARSLALLIQEGQHDGGGVLGASARPAHQGRPLRSVSRRGATKRKCGSK